MVTHGRTTREMVDSYRCEPDVCSLFGLAELAALSTPTVAWLLWAKALIISALSSAFPPLVFHLARRVSEWFVVRLRCRKDSVA